MRNEAAQLLISEIKKHVGRGEVYLPMYARNGLYKAGKAVAARFPDKNIALVPAYSCGDEIYALRSAGFNTVDYGITADLQIDIEDIKEKINDKVGVILVTRYCGIGHDKFSELLDIAHSQGIFIIEDCAHFWPLGDLGDYPKADFLVFSLRKVLNLPHGGVIVDTNSDFGDQLEFLKPDRKVVELSQHIYYCQKTGIFPKGMPIRDIYNSLGLKITNTHGPRFEEYGGYNLGLADSLVPVVINELGNLDRYKGLFKTYVDLMSGTHNHILKLCFSAYTERDCLPAYILFRIEDNEGFEAEVKKLELQNVQRFWTYKHEYVEWEKYSVISDFKNHNYIIDYRQPLGADKIQELAAAIEKYS